ncbi:Rrf2 family transcriptional regulator [Clostridium sartagoforme]|uniref:Rrf2 family transcriptional regulator n=1 Tax=Clostridium sartagoforme TaxID=84031 RepID=A0A4S2DPC4_9CLOT|nr:Rrf2 family transcriptional regulator [Clostridium sartagoforme]TGY44277.1 Rrf2 family transcriptional regulator [Clostridium sartagoforme]
MKINKSFEQGIYVLLMLGLQKDNQTVKSNVMSNILQVSDSYLKKILRKLVLADLITSNASKDGGFQLKKSLKETTLYDVYNAIETEGITFNVSDLAEHVFSDDEHTKQSKKKVLDTISLGINAFNTQLEAVNLSELLVDENNSNLKIDWNERV